MLGGLALNRKIHEATTILSQLGELEDTKKKPDRAVDKVKAGQEDNKQKNTEKNLKGGDRRYRENQASYPWETE